MDTQAESDLRDVLSWILTGKKPSWVLGQVPQGLNLYLVEDRRSALFRGVMNLVMLAGARDLITGNPVNPTDYEVDHLFPKSLYPQHPHVDSVLNMTFISKSTNRKKGKMRPSDFYNQHIVPSHPNSTSITNTFNSHLIGQNGERAFSTDNFQGFLNARKQTILAKMQQLLANC